MTSKRYYYMMCGIFAVVTLFIIAGAAGGNYLLQKQSKKLTAIKLQNKTLEAQQTALAQAKKDIEKYNQLDSIAKSIVPQDKDQAKTVREIVQLAASNNVPIKSVTFPNSTLGAAAATTPGATATGATAKQVPSQLKAVDGIKGVSTLEIQVASADSVKYQNLLNFLNALEQNRRTAHVSAIAITPDGKNRNLINFTLTLNAYVKQ